MPILAVVVRYNTPLDQSKTVRGLCAAFSSHPDLVEQYEVLIWDNSPDALIDPQLSIPFSYQHSERNLGVSGAYNGSLEYALEHRRTWMLLLDQDSTVTSDFLRIMLQHALALEELTEIAAIAPTVKVGLDLASPRQQLFNKNRAYPPGECGIAGGEAIAINSGCIMRANALREIGGYNIDFWLDYSDIYVFHQFYLRGYKVWRAADAELEHEMSIADYDRLMTPWRYKNFSYAETAFHDLYKGKAENAIQTLRLLARAIKQKFKYQNPEFSRIAWQQFLYRLRVPRNERIKRWHAEGRQRGLPLTKNLRAVLPEQEIAE